MYTLQATMLSSLFFFNDTATTEIYTLSLHDALPISGHQSTHGVSTPRRSVRSQAWRLGRPERCQFRCRQVAYRNRDRKSTRLNSSHQIISYAVFCLKKKIIIQ